MARIFEGIINAFSFSEYPAGDWHHGLGTLGLFLSLILFAAALAYLIGYLDQSVQLASWNAGIAKRNKILAVLDAFFGREYVKVLMNQVTGVSDLKNGYYKISTSDTEEMKTYLAMITEKDMENPDFWEAYILSNNGEDESLFKALKPEGRVVNRIDFFNGDEPSAYDIVIDDDVKEADGILIVYLKHRNTKDLEETINAYFRDEYLNTLREIRMMSA